MRIIKIALILFSIGISWALSAQEKTIPIQVNSLEDAWQYAFDNNPDQKNDQLRIDQSRLEVKTAKSSRRPTIVGTFSLQRNLSLATTPLPGEIFGQPGQTIDAQFGQEYNYNTGITISKNILDWQASLQSKLAQNSLGITQAQVDVSKQGLKQQIALYYYTAIISQKALKIYQQNLELADSLLSISQQKLNQGLIDALAFHQTEINRQLVEQNIFNTHILLDQCDQQLKLLMGLNQQDKLEIKTRDIESLAISLDLSLNPDKSIVLNEKQLKYAGLEVQLKKAAFVPRLSLTNYWGQQQFRDDFGLSFSGQDWNAYNYLGVNLEVPIFTGFANKNRLKTSKIEYQIAQENLQNARRKASIQDDLLIKNHLHYENLVRNTQETYELFGKKWHLSEQKFKEGLVNLESHLRVFEDYLKAENAYLNALSNLYSNYANIISRQ